MYSHTAIVLTKRWRGFIASFILLFMVYRLLGETYFPLCFKHYFSINKSLKRVLKSQPFRNSALFRLHSPSKSPSVCAPVSLEKFNMSSKSWLNGRDLSISIPKCLKTQNEPWFELDRSLSLKVREDIQYLNPKFSRKSQVTCCFRNLVSWLPSKVDLSIRLSRCMRSVKPGTKFPGEYVTVTCTVDKYKRVRSEIQAKVLHEDIILNVPKKPQVEVNVKKHENALTDDEREERIKVAIIGLRSVSSYEFRKYLPRTSSFLDEMGAIQFTGFNSIGSGSYDNLIPLFSGMNIPEFHGYCAPTPSSTMDDCPFIWKHYKARGFRTAFVEAPIISQRSLFSYHFQPPFRFKAWDYNLRPMIHEIQSQASQKTGRPPHGQCQGNRPTFGILMDHFRKFTTTFNDSESYYFYFLWHASMRFGLPTVDPSTAYVDESLETTLRDLTNSALLNNTVVIILSDEGSDSLTSHSLYPQILQKLPALFFLFPPWFRLTYPTAITRLENNAASMVTPLDLHRTLDDLSNLFQVSSKFLETRKVSFQDGVQSLFLPVSPKRTCETAKIPSSHCLCPEISSALKPLSRQPSHRNTIAQAILDAINLKIRIHSQCLPHQLKRVISVKPVPEAGKKLDDNHQTLLRMYTLETLPGFGVFQAKIMLTNNNTIRSILTLHRINAFRFQSYCVESRRLKPFCYCS